MINKLAILFSVIAIVFTWFQLQSDNQEQLNSESSFDSKALLVPLSLKEELLNVESEWLKIQKEHDLSLTQATSNTQKKQPKSEFAFELNGNVFSLVGIFQQPEKSFAIFKTENSEFKKVYIGEQIIDGFFLKEMDNRYIIFINDGKEIEFELFKSTYNDKS